jgi:hypothetical protein
MSTSAVTVTKLQEDLLKWTIFYLYCVASYVKAAIVLKEYLFYRELRV